MTTRKPNIEWDLCASKCDDGQVIILLAAEEVLFDRSYEPLTGSLGAHDAGSLTQDAANARHLKLLLLLVLGVGDAVGEEEDGVAGIEADRGALVRDAVRNPEREAGQIARYAFFPHRPPLAVAKGRH